MIEDGKIIYRNYFSKNQQEFSLTDIIDFSWQGGSHTVGTRYGSGTKLSNDAFELTFRSGQKLFVEGNQYANFIEIRAFFYNYCIKHHIIEMRPLEERKRSRMK